jgi:hypothetical protein
MILLSFKNLLCENWLVGKGFSKSKALEGEITIFMVCLK